MRYSLGVLSLASLVAITGCQRLQQADILPLSDPRAKEVERLMDAYADQGKYNGMVLVADDGRVIFEKGYGYANEEWGAKADRHSKFRLASITKQFTALMILQQAEAGKLSLDDNISDHLSWYREDTGSRITIHQLLTHTSGIPNYSAFSGFFPAQSRHTYQMRDFVEKYCSNDLESEPGARYSYCNSGYYILGAILEEIEGKPWEDLVDEYIAKRGGMPDTGAYTHTRLMPKRVQGYWRDSEGNYQPAGYQDMSIWRAAGSMYSTANDMLRWDQALRENILLGEEWKEKMFSRQQGGYGYGVNVYSVVDASGESIRYIGHSGSYAGFNNYFAHFPDTGEAFILLNNGGNTEIQAMRVAIANILAGNPYEMPVPSYRIRSEGEEPRLRINQVSSHGVISSDDATFNPVNAAAGTSVYAMNFLIYDGEHAYQGNTSGGDARIIDGVISSDRGSVNNKGMTYTSTDWLKSDLAISTTGTDAPRLELAWTFHNSSTEARSIRLLWFTDADLTTAGSSSSADRIAILPKPDASNDRMVLVFNHVEDAAPDSTTGLLFHAEGAPYHVFGIAEEAGASGYWRNSAPFDAIGPRPAGYQIPEELRGTTQHDADGDGLTDGPRDVGVSIQADLELPAGGSQTVRFLVDFGPEIEL